MYYVEILVDFWLKNWGWVCERLVGIDVVVVNGEKKYCDKNINSDFFWVVWGFGFGEFFRCYLEYGC